jgi:hypothetical protein
MELELKNQNTLAPEMNNELVFHQDQEQAISGPGLIPQPTAAEDAVEDESDNIGNKNERDWTMFDRVMERDWTIVRSHEK